MSEPAPLVCRREGCGHLYAGEHAPGGGNCMWWSPATGEGCACVGFRWVPLEVSDGASGDCRGARSRPRA
jgi:hypothetical protein